MPRASDAFLAELGLQRADHAVHEWGDEPGSEIWRAGLTHPVLMRMLAEAEKLAPFWKVSRDVAFAMLRDLVIEESERSPFDLVAIEEGAESERDPVGLGSMSLGEILTEAAKLTDARHGHRSGRWHSIAPTTQIGRAVSLRGDVVPRRTQPLLAPNAGGLRFVSPTHPATRLPGFRMDIAQI